MPHRSAFFANSFLSRAFVSNYDSFTSADYCFSVFFSCKDILKRAVGHTPKSKTLDEVYLHPKANQMIEAFDSANQLVKDEVLALPEE